MRLSTRGEYGVRAMHDLAQRYQSGPVPLNSIAERQKISRDYLEQLIASLRKAGLVRSVRGSQGGYELARDPSHISIGEILRILEGPVGPVECLDAGSAEVCDQMGECAARTVWLRLRESINEVLDATTLADLCRTREGGAAGRG